MQGETRLKPCRFCDNGTKNLRLMCYADYRYWIMCDQCGTQSDPKQTPREAGENWNWLHHGRHKQSEVGDE